ncbi:MAG: SAM-dependent methyltransferase, partial [Candidatus Limnocylindrales bacterium]
AGEGALAVSILREMDGTPLGRALRYQAVEVDPRRIAVLRERLATVGLANHLEDASDTRFDGIVLANEVVDALPVHRVRKRGDDLRELAVGLGADDVLIETEIAPTTAALAARLRADGVALVDGQTAEICIVLDDWIGGAIERLRRGVLLVIDYGAPAAELYDPVRRRDGTLRAYVRHQVHDDPYRHVGRQDLTAHVDVTAVEHAAQAAGLTTVGITTQAEALMGLGIQDRLQAVQADPSTTFEGYALLRSSLLRLLDPAAMGRFRVMAFGRGWPATPSQTPLGLFAFQLPTRTRASDPTTASD